MMAYFADAYMRLSTWVKSLSWLQTLSCITKPLLFQLPITPDRPWWLSRRRIRPDHRLQWPMAVPHTNHRGMTNPVAHHTLHRGTNNLVVSNTHRTAMNNPCIKISKVPYLQYISRMLHTACALFCLIVVTGLILGLHPASGRRRCKVTPSTIGWAQTENQPCGYMSVNLPVPFRIVLVAWAITTPGT